MFIGAIYENIYLCIILILTLSNVNKRRILNETENLVPSLLLCLFLIFFIGFRPHEFGDSMNYSQWWGRSGWEGFTWETSNVIFDNLYGWMATVFPDATPLFVLLAAMYFTFMLLACRKFFPANTYLAFLVCLGAFSTFSYGTNGLKAGVAASLFLVSLAYRDKIWLSIIFLLLSWGFHHSMQLPVTAYVITLFLKKKEWFFYGWLFCFFMAVCHIAVFQELFASATDESGVNYLIGVDEFNTVKGFRLDFVLYSTMPVIMGYYVKFKCKLVDKLYDIMLNTYLVCNGIWMLCMYANFTNRIAYLSWFMYPLVLFYPCFSIKNEDHPLVLKRKKFILFHLGFTILMALIYQL